MTKQSPTSKGSKKNLKSKITPKTASKKAVGKVKLKGAKERTESSRRWLIRQLNDPYVAKAQDQGYRSRAAFKLIEINEKYKFLKPGITVVDLGAAPGGWSQVAAEKLKVGTPKGGQIVAVDFTEIDPIPGVRFLQADFMEEATLQAILDNLSGGVDVLLSDMAAPACGMSGVDHIRIMNLVEAAYEFACSVLKPGGTFVAKVLQGGTEAELLTCLKKSFTRVTHFKPPASRKDSAEMYVIAQGYRG